MTTKEIRQRALDKLVGESESPELLPITYMEAARTAEGYLEELGLIGHLSVTVEFDRYPSGRIGLTWKAYFSAGENTPSARSDAITAERMLTGFRLELLKLIEQPAIDLASIGAPELPSVHQQGAGA